MSNAEYLEKYGIDTSGNPGDSFNRALSDFTHDVASGGAIRHLCDRGYTVSQIMKLLDYPTPRERVESTFSRHLKEKGILMDELPEEAEILLESTAVDKNHAGTSTAIDRLVDARNESPLYLECRFGMLKSRDRSTYDRILVSLDSDDADYIEGIRWTVRPMFHRLNERMRSIAKRLMMSDLYEVKIYGRKR